MAKSGPILIIEDDIDDKQIFESAVKSLNYNNPIVWHKDTHEALAYLKETDDKVFVIFCDINMPGLNGLEFKSRVDDNPELRKKSIPFVFYSTTANQEAVNNAYTQMTVQGFFKKGTDYAEIKNTLKTILEYWSMCIHPNVQ